MAGERIGKTYEAILKVVLDNLKRNKVFEGNIFWNETIKGISVEPDFTIGPNKDHPIIVIMVTHSGASGNSHMKTWRNLGELCEIKKALTPSPTVFNVVFDTTIKEDLKKLQEASFDGQLLIGDLAYGKEIREWVDRNESVLPVDQEEKVSAIQKNIKTDKNLKKLISEIQNDLKDCLLHPKDDLRQLWDLDSKRSQGKAPKAKNTFLRRGWAKRLLVGDLLSKGKLSKECKWLIQLNLVKKNISTYKITDEELLWFINSIFEKYYKEIPEQCISDGFLNQLIKVKSFVLFIEYGKYVHNHFHELITVDGMQKCLITQYKNPSNNIIVPEGINPPQNIWIYDYIAAMSKASAGRSQAFGYSSFSSHPDGSKQKVGNMLMGRWCTSFICEFFNRKPKFKLPDGVLIFIAKVLSDQLSYFSPDMINKLSHDILDQAIAKEYEAVYLAHRGFAPLLALLLKFKVLNNIKQVRGIRTCFAERSGLTGLAGVTTVACANNTIINWQSSYEGHPADKTKELSGRAVGLRYTWDAKTKQFKKRPGVEKLILLLDGTWKQQHLHALVQAGWDEIFYPDEIDKLKKAII